MSEVIFKTFNIKNKKTRAVSLILALVVLFITILPANVLAESTIENRKNVKAGWFNEVFFEVDGAGRKSGYGYDYQQKIAAYTGWTYEYVEGPWVELLDKLKFGEIDILADVSYTDERAEEMLFSAQPMGTEDYYLMITEDNTEINPEQYSTLNDKKIGVNKGSVQEDIFIRWAKERGIKAEVVELVGQDEDYMKMLERGELDGVVSLSSYKAYRDKCVPIVWIGSSDYYFAISKERPELKVEIDKAMTQIFNQNRYYNRYLEEKYMSDQSNFRFLSASEVRWIKNHGTIRVGYRDNYLPFSGQDEEGKVDGLLKDFISLTENRITNANIVFEAIPYASTNDAIRALEKGDIDCVFPLSLSTYDAEENGLLLTEPIAESEEFAIIRAADYNKFDFSTNVRVAVNSGNPNYVSFIYDNFPNWTIVKFRSTDECLKGVADGKADCLLTSNYRQNVLSGQMEELNLSAISTGTNTKISFAVKKGETDLYSIIGRLANFVTTEEMHTSLSKHSVLNASAVVQSYFNANSSKYLLLALTIIMIISFLLMVSLSNGNRARRYNARLRKANNELELQDSALIAATERAEAASKAKTRFLFNMSHDIRTPMNAIIGFADLLEKNQDDPEKRADYINKIKHSSNFLLELINNVLELARIESGKVVLNETVCDTPHIMDEITTVFLDQMEKKNINFISNSSFTTEYIYCDEVKMKQIFLNILSNAYKYTPSGGTIRLDVEEKASDRKGYINVQTTISDNGKGMAEDFIPRLFDDFSREKTVTENKIEGTGLGMAIVKRMLEILDGTISVESQLGKGTTFTVTIPHKVADVKEVKEGDSAKRDLSRFKGKRILLAEDNELNAEIAIEVLRDAGFKVNWAEDGKKCVEMLDQNETGHYDLILMDIQMPNMNGYEATHEIRNMTNLAKANIPIIAMTANAFEEDRQNAFEAGMNGHLAKPVKIDIMLEEIARIL